MAKNIEDLINLNNKYIQKKQLPISQKIIETGKEEVELSSIFRDFQKEEQDKTISPVIDAKQETTLSIKVIKEKKEEIKTEIEQFEVKKQQIDRTVTPSTFNKTGDDKTVKSSVFKKSRTDKTVTPSTFSKSGTDKTVTPTTFAKSGTDKTVTPSTFSKTGIDKTVTPSTFSKTGTDKTVTPSTFSKTGTDKTIPNSKIDDGYGTKVFAESFSKVSGNQKKIPPKAYVEFQPGERNIYGQYINLYDFAKASGLEQSLPTGTDKTVTQTIVQKASGGTVDLAKVALRTDTSGAIVLNKLNIYGGVSRFFQEAGRDLNFIRIPRAITQFIVPRDGGESYERMGIDSSELATSSDPRRKFMYHSNLVGKYIIKDVIVTPRTTGHTRTQGDGGDSNVYIDISNQVKTTDFQDANVGEDVRTERTIDLSKSPKKDGLNSRSDENTIEINNKATKEGTTAEPAKTVDYSQSQRLSGTTKNLPSEKTIGVINTQGVQEGDTYTQKNLDTSPKKDGIENPDQITDSPYNPVSIGIDNKTKIGNETIDLSNSPKETGLPKEGLNEANAVLFTDTNDTTSPDGTATVNYNTPPRFSGVDDQSQNKIQFTNQTIKEPDGKIKTAGSNFDKPTGKDQQANNVIVIPEITEDTPLATVAGTPTTNGPVTATPLEELSLKNSKLKLTSGIDTILQEKINTILGNLKDTIKASRPGEIGFLYIKPITTSANYLPFKIPFEFNPKISESGLSARYNAVSFLSRVGDIQNFTGVAPLTINIQAEYEVLSTSTQADDDSDYWMNFYTQDNLDKIEMAYRSLILPDFILNNSQTTYIRPPAIKIIFGDEKKLNLSENNRNLDYSKGQFEFSYPSYPNNVSALYNSNKILQSQNTNPLRFHKLFVATNLTITKDTLKENIFTKDGINRFTGFSVDLTLVEVTENYMDLLPDYKVYYEFFKNSSMPRRG